MGIFAFEPGLAIWTWISFGILLLLMYKYVFPRLLQNIKDREKAISDSIDNAEEIQRRLDKIEEEHKQILKEAKKKSDKLLLKTRDDADKLKKELLEKAEDEASAVLQAAKKRIMEEQEVAMESLHEDIAAMICDTTEKVIGRSFLKKEDLEWTRTELDKWRGE